MRQEEIIEQLKFIVTPYTKNVKALQNINENTDFLQDLEINSAHLVDIILDIEEAFNIEIDNESMEKMLDIRSAMDVIDSKIVIG